MGYGFGVWGLLSSLISAVLGGGMVWIFTIRIQKRKQRAEATNVEALAESSELNNVEKAIKIWREMAESLKIELTEQRSKADTMSDQIEQLRKEIARLTRTNNRIIELLNNMNQDNFERMVQKIKDEIQKD